MKLFYRTCMAFIGLFFLLSCNFETTQQTVPFKMRTLAFGTWVDISIYDISPQQAQHIGQQLDDALQKMHSDWHAWHPGVLNTINNQLQQGKTVTLDKQMQQLIELAIAMEQRSNGLFNPAIGELLKLWGFQRDDPFNLEQIPTQQQIDAYLANRPSTSQLTLRGNQLSSENPHLRLDFGGFGKGFGVELLIKQLQSQGFQNVLVNAGGDLMLSGEASDHPWHIAIQSPFQQAPIATLSLQGEHAVFTSGNYQRGFVVDGINYHHILNPLTGFPARGIAAVTVIGNDGAWSDAAATSLLLAGVDEAFQLAPKMGVSHLLLITDDGQLHIDEGMLNYIKFSGHRPSNLITHVLATKL